MAHHNRTGDDMKIRWIRVFTAGNDYRDHDGNWTAIKGLPTFGDFQGTIRFDRITGIYPNQRDERYLNVQVKGESNETYAFTMILKSDLHMVAPELAATFPLPIGGAS